MKVSERTVFIIGWLYYIVIPVIVAYTGFWDRFDPIQPWLNYFDSVNPYVLMLPMYGLFMPIAFFSARWPVRSLPRKSSNVVFSLRLCTIILIPVYIALLIWFVFRARGVFFSGYSQGVDISLVGPISTLEMLFLFHLLISLSIKYRIGVYISSILLFYTSVLLLSSGGRIYVLTSFVAVYFYYLNWGGGEKKSLIKSFSLFLFIALISVAVGMWRVGDFNINMVGFYIFAEPLFTSTSAITLFQSGHWGLFDTQKDFFNAFLNVIPSSLWADKTDLMGNLLDANLGIENPFGAMSIVASSVGNFGFIGGLFFIASVGVVIALIRQMVDYPLYKALYCYLVGLLPFIFFRDPFHIQFKLVITGFGLLLTYTIIYQVEKFFPRIRSKLKIVN